METQAHYSIDQLTQSYIGGHWRHGKTDQELENTNPYNGELIFKFKEASSEDIDEACLMAKKQQEQWASTLPSEKAALLNRVAEVMETRKEEIVNWLIQEAGSTYQKASLEHSLAKNFFKSAAVIPFMIKGKILPTEIPGKESLAYKQPIGVVALISPWNFPLQLTTRTLAPALATGNGVVIKSDQNTPVTGGSLLAAILEEAGFPSGLVSVLHGSGSHIGDDLIKHKVPRVLSFTGSTKTGRKVGKMAIDAHPIKRLELELGGNNPMIVMDDANIEQAVEAASFGRYMHNGQICMAINRLIVMDKIHDDFVNTFVERVKKLKVGDPRKKDTAIGPLINGEQKESVKNFIDSANSEGCHCLLGEEIDGNVIPPHIFSEVKTTSVLFNEEIFGPVMPIIRAHDEREVLELANKTHHGLSSSIFSQDLEKALRIAKQIEAGMTHINDQTVNDLPFSPFGGEKDSGVGRFNGDWAIDAFTTDHWISIQHQPREYWV